MVTVGDLLGDDALGLISVHVPDPDAEVRWVAPSELADPTPFLEGGEVLLTTGLEAVGWRSEWQQYADRLVAARVVGVGFATGLSHRGLPRSLVRACEAVGLNLFEVPRQTTFVAISRATARMIDMGAEAEARRSLQVQRQLTQAALRPREPEALVGRLAEMLDGAVAVLGRDGQVELGPLGPRADDLDLALVGAEVARIRPQGLRAASTVQSAGETLVVQPVGLAGRPSSYLAVLLPGRAGDIARSGVATAVSLLGLAAESDRAGRRAARRLRARALELLVEADAGTAALVLSAGSGREVSLPDRVAVVRAHGPGEALDDALGAVEDVVPLAGRIGDELWLVATPGVAGRQADLLAERGLLVGVGDPAPVDDAGRSHANAGQALRAATPTVPAVRWRRLVKEGAMGVLDDERAAAFAASYLAPIADDPELVRTLQSFLGHHGSRLKVAEELGVHRNTVRNRLEQVEVALDGSLDDPQVRVNAWIALQVVARGRPM